jgi:hypothetical protein
MATATGEIGDPTPNFRLPAIAIGLDDSFDLIFNEIRHLDNGFRIETKFIESLCRRRTVRSDKCYAITPLQCTRNCSKRKQHAWIFQVIQVLNEERTRGG